ncbi:Dvir\GJ22977-PA-like protein [Anopheles sinensis]|uniref:Dvir\GJ22977-PA-like protein n=1 Tax=Anopheles sinensis TaxID=74873 RepID=A0A084VFS0_ANOSI|nr:Dvir\GJ22977-PA-like protein [Anopheles sinensis]
MSERMLMLSSDSEQQRQVASSTEELNFTAFIDLCRFCAIKSGSRFCSLFDNREAEQRQLLFKIRTVLPIVITKEDFLPKKICERCIHQVEQFFAWRTNCVQTEIILRNYAESMRVVSATINFQALLPGYISFQPL